MGPGCSRVSRTSTEYRCGESGVQSFGSGTLIRNAFPGTPPPVALKSSVLTETVMWSDEFATSTTHSTSPRSMSGVNRTLVTCTSLTGSIQTVCQMPETGVYQIPPGFLTCLPRGWTPSFVVNDTPTT